LVFARETDGGRGWSSWGAIQSRRRRRRGAFLYATEQKRGAGTGQLEQNKAVALLGPKISNGGQYTVGVVAVGSSSRPIINIIDRLAVLYYTAH